MTTAAQRIPPADVDFVICGNVTRDLVPGGWAPGGTAVYAAAVANGLGRRVGVVTAAPADVVAAGLAPTIAVARADAPEATSYENVYTPAGRIQYLRAPGSPIPPETLPEPWAAARAVLLGPVYHEVLPALVERFQGGIGVCAQGFLRTSGPDGRVSLIAPDQWDALPVLRRTAVLFLSEEDLARAAARRVPPAWLDTVPVTVLTAGRRGARVHVEGRWWSVPAVPAEEVDPTGAGDSFAAGFLAARDEGADPVEAARFAAAVAALTVEAHGPRTPSRADALARVDSAPAPMQPAARTPPPGTRR